MSAGHRKLRPQHAPKTPHEDQKFLQSTPARPLRILAEYIHPLVQLKKEGIGDTIVMFGSARIESHETAQARYTRLKREKTGEMSAAHLTGLLPLQPRVTRLRGFMRFDARRAEHHDGVADALFFQLHQRMNVFAEDSNRPRRRAS